MPNKICTALTLLVLAASATLFKECPTSLD